MDPRRTAARQILLLGVLLTILGVGTFALIRFDPSKWTALLPAFFGVLFLGLGAVAQRRPEWHRYAFYTAAALALLAVLGASGGLVKTAALIAGADVERPAAAVEQAIMAVLCVGFLGAAAKWFIETRRAHFSEGA